MYDKSDFLQKVRNFQLHCEVVSQQSIKEKVLLAPKHLALWHLLILQNAGNQHRTYLAVFSGFDTFTSNFFVKVLAEKCSNSCSIKKLSRYQMYLHISLFPDRRKQLWL